MPVNCTTSARHLFHAPALSGFLRGTMRPSEPSGMVFVDFMGRFANSLAAKHLHEATSALCHPWRAVSLCTGLWPSNRTVRTHCSTYPVSGSRVFSKLVAITAPAQRLFTELADHQVRYGNRKVKPLPITNWGESPRATRFLRPPKAGKKIAGDRRKQGNEHGAAITYHQLGTYRPRANAILSRPKAGTKNRCDQRKTGQRNTAPRGTYHQLGRIAEEQRDF